MIYYFKRVYSQSDWEFESVKKKEFIQSDDMFKVKVSKSEKKYRINNNLIIYKSFNNKIYPFNFEIIKDEYKKHLINYRDKRINEVIRENK